MESCQLMDPQIKKLIWWYIKYRARYPRIKNKSMYLSEPNSVLGLTDHPLDDDATPVSDVFSLLSKWRARKPISILSVKLSTRRENSFIFSANGYDIIHDRDLTVDYVDYLTDEKVKKVNCTLQIDIINSTTYRLRLSQSAEVPDNVTPMVYSDITDETIDATVDETDEKYIISTPMIKLHIYKESFRIQVYKKDGSLITESGSRTHNEFFTATDSFPLGFVKNRGNKETYAVENFNLFPNESIFGLGEKFSQLDRVGQTISLWHLEGLGNTSGRAYKHMPFFLSSRGYGVFFNDFNPMTFWVGTREVSKIMVAIENELIDYYFFFGPTPKEVLHNYTALTGRAKTPPRWTLGTWMSRLSYSSQEEVLEVAERIRNERIPCDVIHIDTNWFTHEWKCDWEFDKTRFPDPSEMFRKCAELGFKISLWQSPYVIDSLDIKKDGKSKGVFAKNHGPFIFLNVGPAHVIDFSRPEAVEWYQQKLRALFELGARIIKVDFGEQIESHQEFAKYSGREMHNLYPLLYNKAAFDVAEEYFGEGQAVIWARSAYAGSQRYPVHWSGDNSSNYANMLASIRGGLSLGLCGFSFWSQDIGGFVGIPDDKLYTRWTALSIFQSHIRFHGCEPKHREPWHFSSETQENVKQLLEFRYRLIPYLFSESIKSSGEGLPVMRHLLLEFSQDPMCYHIEDQFCCGENLLVAPIFTEDDSRRVYLPEGNWCNFWTGALLQGPLWINVNDVPLTQTPLFIKAGTILPMGEPTQYVSETTTQGLELHAYPSQEGTLNYTLRDEIGAINFQGTIKGDRLIIEVSASPKDRSIPELKCQLPPSHRSLDIEFV